MPYLYSMGAFTYYKQYRGQWQKYNYKLLNMHYQKNVYTFLEDKNFQQEFYFQH